MNYCETQPLVVGIGELLWDILPDQKRLGGAPANFAHHAHSLGARAIVISAIGKDHNGQEIISQLNSQNINTKYVQTNELPTGTVDVTLSPDGQPNYTIHENVAWDAINTHPTIDTLSQNCNAICFGTLAQRNNISKNTILGLLENTKENCLKVFDINLRQNYYSKELIENSLSVANIVKLNNEELAYLQNIFNLPTEENRALESLLNHFKLDTVALTQGSKGSTMINQDSISFCPGIPVDVKDTIGAGDSFTAAITMGVLANMSLNKINMAASKIAAYVCSQSGATPTIPDSLISVFKDKTPIPITETYNSNQKRKSTL